MASKDVVEILLRVKDEYSAAFKKAEKAADGLAESARMSVVAMGKLSAGMLAAGAALGSALQHISDTRRELTDMNARTGVSVENLQALKFAANRSGREFSDMNEVLNPLVARLGQAASGADSARAPFEALGIDLPKDGIADINALLPELIDKLGAIEDPTARSAAAVAVLGESGGKLLEVVGSSEQFDAFGDFAREFGSDSGPAAAQAANDWQQQMTILRTVLEGFGNIIGQAFGPATAALANFTTGLVFIVEFAKQMPEAVRGAFDVMVQDIQSVFESIETPAKLLASGDVLGALEAFKGRVLGVHDATTEAGVNVAANIGDAFDAAEQHAFRFLETTRAISAAGVVSPAAPGAVGPTAKPEEAAATEKPPSKEEQATAETNIDLFNQMIDQEKAAQAWREQQADNERILAERTATAIEEQRRESGFYQLQTADSIGSVHGALAGGLPGILSALGPGGAIAGAVVGLLSDLPALIDGITESIDDLLVGIVEGLPDILFELIPALLQALLISLPRAIAEAVGEIFTRLFKIFAPRREEKMEERLSERRERQQEKLREGRRGLIGAIDRSFANSGEAQQSFADGSKFISRTGLAMVHRGEQVVPRHAAGGTGGGGVVVNINGVSVLDAGAADRLVEQLKRHIGDFGSGVQSF